MVAGKPSARRAGLRRALLAAVVLLISAAGAAAADIRIVYIGAPAADGPPPASEPTQAPSDEGVQGARLGIDDNNTTGRFFDQHFTLDEKRLGANDDAAALVHALQEDGTTFVIADLRADALDRLLAAAKGQPLLIFNAGAPDDRFRNADCQPFLLHTLPSRAMLADALAQYLVRKQWTHWFLVPGKKPGDALYADALRRSARKFGADVVADKPWLGTFDARRTAVEEIPLFTQGVRYDVLLVADEAGTFGKLFPYRTWDPRPVAGTQGLVASGWHPELEQWGAAQLQSRFLRKAGRPMTSRDYAAWAAVRSIGEAATRTKSTERAAIAGYILSPDFELAAFKGLKLSYRTWDGQLRQPIPLGWSESVVSVSPQEGFLHQTTELDTLGFDAPETGCHTPPKP